MASVQAVNLHDNRQSLDRNPLQGKDFIEARAAGTAYCNNSLFFRIQVDHYVTPEHTHVKSVGAQHPDLFICGKHAVKGRMGNRRIIKDSQHIGYRDAVVTTEGGALGIEQIAIHGELQRIFGKIMVAVRFFDSHHIDMPLEYDRLRLLVAFRPVRKNDDISVVVYDILQLPFFGKCLDVFCQFFCIAGTVRYFRNLFKIVKYFFRIQSFR